MTWCSSCCFINIQLFKSYIKGHLPTCISQYINEPQCLFFPIQPWSEWSGSYILVPHCDEGSGLPHLSLCPRVWCTCRTHSWGTPSPSCWRWCPSLPAYDHCRYVCTAAHCILPRSGEIERFVKQNIRKWKLTASKKNES